MPTFGETRQFADFLAFLGMQRGRAAYAVTGENLLSPPRLGCHPHGITKSGQEPTNHVKPQLLRFERIQQRHYGMKLMVYTLINVTR